MKYFTLVICLLVAVFFRSKAIAQTISGHVSSVHCMELDSLVVGVTGCMSGDSIVTFYGDGTMDSAPVYCTGALGNAYDWLHTYSVAGVYTVKVLLISGGVAVDSFHFSQAISCSEIQCYIYIDANHDCSFDAGDTYIEGEPATIEIDSAGVPLDTITTIYKFSYPVLGPTGTIYSFKVLNAPVGFTIGCPGDTVLYDTLGITATDPNVGFVCDSMSSFDLSLSANFCAGLSLARSDILITSTSCSPTSDTLIIIHSPKYQIDSFFLGSFPYHLISGDSVIITLGFVYPGSPFYLLMYWNPTTTLGIGDTVHTTFIVKPFAGDINTANNVVTIIDTIFSSYDPNYKSVTPAGNIEPGTSLKYMIAFENTGNDTAFNIHIMDTLSDNLDISTFKVVTASAPMDLIFLASGGYNIVKFDFPNIDLLDTSHHPLSTGIVAYTISAKTGLPEGTKIDNKAGVFFDGNPVVMTNMAENIIGEPTTSTISSSKPSEVFIYPNPTTNLLNVTGIRQNTNYRLLDITGLCIQKGNFIQGSNTLNVKNIIPAIYILEMTGADGQRKMARVVKY